MTSNHKQVKRLQESSYQRGKYSKQFTIIRTHRHWCFEFVRGDDSIAGLTSQRARMLAHLNANKKLGTRITRFIKRVKMRMREKKIQKFINNKKIEELAMVGSSEISEMGSQYEYYDVHEENLRTGQSMIEDLESDFDLRIQAKVLNWFKPTDKGKRRVHNILDVWETLYEEHMLKATQTWPTRQALRKAKLETFSQRFVEFFQKAMKHGRTKIVLTTTEFYLCLLLYEFNMSQLICFGHAFNQGGIAPAVVIYILVSFFIQMPFNMWIITMCSYSGSLSLRLFSDCMPLASAIRYSIFLAFVIAESRRLLNYEAVVKLLFVTLVKGGVWTNCTFESATQYCIPFGTKTDHNMNCTKERERDANYEFFSTQFYVQYDLFQIGNVGEALKEDVKFWGDAASKYYGPALGIVSFIIAANGIEILKKITIKAQILVIVLAAVCVLSVTLDRIAIFSDFTWNYSNANLVFAINFISLSLQTNSLPILMWLATMKPPDLNPATCSVVFQCIKFVVLMIMSLTYSSLAYNIAKRYKMENIACFTLEGYDLVFTMAPDFFATFRFSPVWQMTWLISVTLIAVIYSVYMILAASDSLIQVIPNGDSYATLFMFLVTLTVIAFRLINEIPYAYQTLVAFELRGLNYINNFNFGLVVICIYFLYTPVRFRHEYEVIFGTQPARFWVLTWHFMISIGLLVLILTLMDLFAMDTRVTWQYVMAFLFILSASCLFCMNCIKLTYIALKTQTTKALFYPTHRWGPQTKENRDIQRQLERKKRLTLRFHCRHKCFMESKRFIETKTAQEKVLLRVLQMQGTSVYSWYIRETILKDETVQFYNRTIIEEN